MIKLSLTFSFLLAALLCSAQENHKLYKDTSHFKNSPLFVLELPLSNPVEATGIIAKPEDIESINVFKDSATLKEYGEKAANGLIIIKLKINPKLLTLKQLLVSNQIKDTNLPVYIDSAIAYKPTEYLFEPAMVKSAKIETEKETGMKYVSITTLFPVHRLKSDEIYVK
ncbi:MAG: hypothetical protein ABI113_12600 [Mucilaginibacter sp.]